MKKGQEEIEQMTKELKSVKERYKRFLIREGVRLEELARQQLDKDFANYATDVEGVFFGGNEDIKVKYYKRVGNTKGNINIFFMLNGMEDKDFDEHYSGCCEYLSLSSVARLDELYANYGFTFEQKCDTFINYMECLKKIINKNFWDDEKVQNEIIE